MTNPDIVTGVALALLFAFTGTLLRTQSVLGFWTLLIAHITFDFPYVILNVMTLWRGSSDENGSWKMMVISVRRRRIFERLYFVMSLPSKMILPEVGSISFKIARPVVDLPQPDSPTMPSVLPCSIWKLTPSTACSRPLGVLKYLVR